VADTDSEVYVQGSVTYNEDSTPVIWFQNTEISKRHRCRGMRGMPGFAMLMTGSVSTC